MRQVLTLFMILLISILTASLFAHSFLSNTSVDPPQIHIGVAFCGNTTAEAKLLIDRVKTYTNLFVLQSGPIVESENATNEILDYAIENGLDIIVYFGWFNPDYPWRIQWLDYAEQRWGSRLLGVYLNDELGGVELDHPWEHYFRMLKERNSTWYLSHAAAIEDYLNGSSQNRDYDTAAKIYSDYLNDIDTGVGLGRLKTSSITAFMSDYALFWFDYKAGYDVLLAQVGWNHTLPQDIALVRGAARMQNKTWGIIITWKYDEEPIP